MRRRVAPVSTVVIAVVLWFVPTVRETLDFPVFYLLFGYGLFFWIAQASSWNILTGYSGYFSFGQGAFFGVGVYGVATLAAKQGWPLLPSVVVGGALAALLGVIIGLVVFRLRKLRGEIFALMTLAVAFVMAALARVSPSIDGGQGVPVNEVALPEFLGDFPEMIFRLGLIVATITVVIAQVTQTSRLGWGLFAIRDDEDVAETLGVPTFRFKMIALGLSAFLAGLSGAIHTLQIGYVTIEDVFNIRVPLFVILMSVLGGTRHWMGPILGAVVVYTLNDRLNSAGLQDVSDVAVGAALILMILAVKEGLYLRMRQHPLLTVAGAAVGLIGGVLLGATDSLVSLLGAVLIGAVLVALVPPHVWRGRMSPAPPEETSGEAREKVKVPDG